LETTNNKCYSFLFKGGPPLIDGGRVWGVHEKVIWWATSRQSMLRTAWDFGRLRRGSNDGGDVAAAGAQVDASEQSREESARVMRLAGDAIQSKFFWIYLQMLQSLSSVLKHMTAWSHSCPSHSVHARDLIGQQAEEVDQDRKKVQEKCPLRGLRAPCMAAGALKDFIAEVLRMSQVQLALRRAAWLEPDERIKVMSDFEAGRAHFAYEFQIKVPVHDVLPLRLMAFGNMDL